MGKASDRGCEVLLYTCAGYQPGEKVVIVTDDSSHLIGEAMYDYCVSRADTTLVRMADRQTHGTSPTAPIGAAIAAADIIFGASTFSIYNTPERIFACEKGARFVNMSDYSMDMLEEGCLFVDYADAHRRVGVLSRLILGKHCVITTPAGTHLTADITGRMNDDGYGTSLNPGEASSPPNIETAVGPLTAEGVIVVDGSIPMPGLGAITEPITCKVEKGRIVSITGGREADRLREGLAAFCDERVYVVAEIGFGLNKASKISGRMLQDEGMFGTMHIGIGNNLSYGGDNDTPVHIDLIMLKPSYTVDGRKLYEDGRQIF